MTPAALVETLRARGLELLTDGRRIGVRPAGVLTAEEREAVKRHKAEILALLTEPVQTPFRLTLDHETVREVLGPHADAHAIACIRFDVIAAVREIQIGIRAGVLPPRRLVYGRPLADWLSLHDVARLLRAGGAPR